MEDVGEELIGKEAVASEVHRYVQETLSGDRKMVVISVVEEEIAISILNATTTEAVLMQRCALRESIQKVMDTAEALLQAEEAGAKH